MVCGWVGNSNARRHRKSEPGINITQIRSLTVKGPKRVELAGALGSDGQRNAALNW